MPKTPSLLIIAVLAAGFAGSTPTLAGDDAPVAFSDVSWIKRPGRYHIAKYVPRAAALAKVDGRVVLHCRFSATGRTRDCVVFEETPGGYGFGQAALKLTPIYKAAMTSKSGLPLAGRLVAIPITYDLEKLAKPNSG